MVSHRRATTRTIECDLDVATRVVNVIPLQVIIGVHSTKLQSPVRVNQADRDALPGRIGSRIPGIKATFQQQAELATTIAADSSAVCASLCNPHGVVKATQLGLPSSLLHES
jgi:hypothetical protein